MVNRNLFRTFAGTREPKANTINEAGGTAYQRSDEEALAQYAVTGCLRSTFYASETKQLTDILQFCANASPIFIAKTAIYARQKGFMKDLPALLCAVLAVKDVALLESIFDKVIDSPKMLRNFVQIIRSGMVGRKSFGSAIKRMIRHWLEIQSDKTIFNGSVGTNPRMTDIIKMVHPRPATEQRTGLYNWLLYPSEEALLFCPEFVRQYDHFMKALAAGEPCEIPDVPFQMLASLPLKPEHWKQLARKVSWQTLRMNINTFARHGVFDDRDEHETAEFIADVASGKKQVFQRRNDSETTRFIADRLCNPEEIARAKVFPYQLLAACLTTENIPQVIREALTDAMELALNNVPKLKGKIYIFLDVSASMDSPISGYSNGSTSKVRCIDVAALFATALFRKNEDVTIMPFECCVRSTSLQRNMSTLDIAKRLSAMCSGGTNCSAPLDSLNKTNKTGDMCIYISDNQSWMDTKKYNDFQNGQDPAPTETMKQWSRFKKRSPQAKLVCIDLQPSQTRQTVNSPDITNIGGFSDDVFSLVAGCQENVSANYFVDTINAIEL